MAIICCIPARGGSRRIKHKNIKLFHGKPIIAYSIENAQLCGLFDRIIVSTDDLEIAGIAADYGAEIWMREAYYGRDYVGTQEVVKECLIGIEAKAYDTVCCLYATAPLLSIDDLQEGYTALASGADYSMSVGYPPLQDAGQFYWGLCFNFLKDIPLISTHTRLIHVAANRVCDINTHTDWRRAVKMYEELHK